MTTTKSNSSIIQHSTYSSPSITLGSSDRHHRRSKNKLCSLGGTAGVLLGALLGFGVGYLLSTYASLSDDVKAWFSLPGDLFIRALKCIVVPMVFVTLTVGMADIVRVGKASKIGWRSALIFLFTTIVAAAQGLFWALYFKDQYIVSETVETETATIVAFRCNNKKYMELNAETGAMECTADSQSVETAHLEFTDINNQLDLNSEANIQSISISDQLQGLLEVMVPDNITQAFATGSLLSIVMFAIPFGVALAHASKKSNSTSSSSSSKNGYVSQNSAAAGPPVNFVLEFMRQLNTIFLLLVKWLIKATAVAVFFLVGGSVLTNDESESTITNVGYFLLTIICATMSHLCVVQPLLYALIVRENPWVYMKQLVPAQLFAFGCASSIATLPVTMRCVDSSKKVSRPTSRFVLSLGTTVNMDGAALYYPAAFIFLCQTGSRGTLSAAMDPINLAMLVLISSVASIGGAPVPSAALVMVLTVWQTLLGSDYTLPNSFNYLVAVDWLADRFRTTVNVTADAMACRMIAAMVPVPEGSTNMEKKQRRRRRRQNRKNDKIDIEL